MSQVHIHTNKIFKKSIHAVLSDIGVSEFILPSVSVFGWSKELRTLHQVPVEEDERVARVEFIHNCKTLAVREGESEGVPPNVSPKEAQRVGSPWCWRAGRIQSLRKRSDLSWKISECQVRC